MRVRARRQKRWSGHWRLFVISLAELTPHFWQLLSCSRNGCDGLAFYLWLATVLMINDQQTELCCVMLPTAKIGQDRHVIDETYRNQVTDHRETKGHDSIWILWHGISKFPWNVTVQFIPISLFGMYLEFSQPLGQSIHYTCLSSLPSSKTFSWVPYKHLFLHSLL